ncbi:protein NRT1/ PTR FAMILY 5.5-like isoform X2 [Amaranthus tricolor]|nr:protein NRT1/ PTR FAMILY 5.5-like isoform X2 [Amaranthus tricolor]
MWADVFAYYVLWMMMVYLTDVWKLDFTHAAAIINIWRGSALVLPLLFVHLADAFLGNLCTLLLTSLSYTLGLGLLWMSTPPVLSKINENCTEYKPECIGDQQKQLFYAALALIAVGMAGHLTSLPSFMAEQTQLIENEFMATATRAEEQGGGSGCCLVCRSMLGGFMGILIPIIGLIIVTYVKPWGVQFGVSALFALGSLVVFLSGIFSYNYVSPQGSELTIVFRVFVAAFRKMFCRCPQDVNQLYESNDVGGAENHAFLLHTKSLRCLDKAAIILPQPTLEEQQQQRWKLCRVTEVEATKISIRMIPLWITIILCGLVSAIGDTYFLQQATSLNRKLGRIKLPLIFLLWFYDQSKSLFTKIFVMAASITTLFGRQTSTRRYVSSIGIAISIMFSVLCCIAAAKVETRRLETARNHGLIDKPDNEKVGMSMFWLLPQFALLGGLDGIREFSVGYLVNDQAPNSMIKYFNYVSMGSFGVGIMGSAVSVYVVGRISKKISGINWFQSTLNKSRLDNYYWVLAALSAVNLVGFVLLAWFYRYREPTDEELEEPEFEETETNLFNHIE